MAVPIVLGQLGQVLFAVMDNAMVGRLGALPLAAAGFANTVTAIPMLFLIGVASSISVMVAKAATKGDHQGCGRYTVAGLSLLMFCMVLLMAFAEFGPDFLLWFKQPDDVLQESRKFFQLIAWSMLPMVIFQALRQFTVGLEKAFLPTVILGLGLIANFLISYAFIYGNWGAPKLGIVGAGYATLAARTLMTVCLVLVIWKWDKFAKYRSGFSMEGLKPRYFKPIAKMGLTSGLQYLFEVGAFTAAGFMAGWVGTQALAAHQVSLNIASITFMVAWGISFAASVRVGQAMAHGNKKSARERGYAALFLIFAAMSSFGIILVIAHNFIPQLYIHDEDVIAVAKKLLMICAIFQIFDGLQGVAVGVLRGLGDVGFPSVATLIIYWGVCIPASYFMAFKLGLGVSGLWWGLTLGLALAAIVLGARFHYLTDSREVARKY